MNIEELQKEILQSTDLQRLREIQFEVNKLIGTYHKNIAMAQTTIEEVEEKANLKNAYATLQVCRDRVDEVIGLAREQREMERQDGMEQNRINYNFRMAAKILLERNTYDSIMAMAIKTRKEVKEQANELKKNKLE